MKQVEDRIKLMHLRAKQIKRKDDMIHTAIYGVTSLVLLVFLIVFTLFEGGSFHSVDTGQLTGNALLDTGQLTGSTLLDTGQFTGTSMLDQSVGGYVMVGVLSFAAAVAITLLCLRWKQKDSERSKSDNAAECKNEKERINN